MTREARQFRCPENVLGWIPWYADGGLSDQQRGRVEAHAAECLDCRAELDIVAGAPFEIDMELPDPDRLFREITARIDAGEREASPSVIPIAGSRQLEDDELDRIGQWVLDESTEESFAQQEMAKVVVGPWSVRRVAYAAAAAIAILFVGGIGGALLSKDDAGTVYQSATVASELANDATSESASSIAPMLDVVFLDSASLREISEALRAVGVEIVAGPSPLGVYRVQLLRVAGDREPTAADVAAIANRLKAPGSAIALFAEAVP